ncbi:MAG: RsmB/NOP family class I SAM-dependent RNA methyltransferase, partial [Rhodospirillaceae bacterium]
TGMINAILCRVDREGRAVLDGFDPDPLRDVPRFFRESWKQAYGAETASAIAGASLAQAPLDVHLKQPTQGTTDWATTLSATPLPQAAMLRVDPGAEVPPVPQMAGFDDGAWWIQDMAASLPVQLLGDLADQEMLDLCAAPGGKTLQAAARGAKVTALDRSENRLKAVRENLARCGLEAEVIAAEAQDWEPEDPEKRFARILLDAPCSATGTLRRHPDALWLKDKMTVAALSDVQAALLDRAADLLGPDGVLVYCVCSLQPEEGAAQVEAFLARADGQIVREPLKPEDLGLSDPDLAAALITADGDLRSFPFHLAERGGMDGFYAAKLRRIP